MNILLLSGGSGKRLWPLSNDVRSKQFLKLLGDGSGGFISMVQRVYGQIRSVYPDAGITIAASTSQTDIIRNQLGDSIDLVLEPERRDTFPAIVLSCIYLAMEKGLSGSEPVIVMPVDPFTEPEFFQTLVQLENAVKADLADIALIGIRPTIPTSKYGYILPGGELSGGVFSVTSFVEKPNETEAVRLIERGAVWNGGVFAFKLSYLMDIARKSLSFSSFGEALGKYGELEKISFDYKVVEKAERAVMIPFNGMWTDIGTWRTLTGEMSGNPLGNAVMEDCVNTFAVNELGIPLVVLGTRGIVAAASPDGILVSDLTASSRLKPLVDGLGSTRPMYEERRWGQYTVVEKTVFDDGGTSLIKHLALDAGKRISYQSHKYRDEVWTVINGEADVVLDSTVSRVKTGDVIKIQRGQKHAVRAVSNLHIAEVQIGSPLTEDDIERFEWQWE